MQNVYQKVTHWNAQRYERKFDLELTINLLREEYQEWLKAKNPVDKLDGLCDIVYVAMGAIWKANINEGNLYDAEAQAIQVVQSQIDCNELWPGYYISTYLDVMEYDEDYPLAMSLQLIICTAMAEMTGLGLDHAQCVEALNIVCASNASKSIKKTASNIKANDGDKGPFFVPPEPKLKALLEVARGRLN